MIDEPSAPALDAWVRAHLRDTNETLFCSASLLKAMREQGMSVDALLSEGALSEYAPIPKAAK